MQSTKYMQGLFCAVRQRL
ncbi:hypothetical protein NQ317_011023 [Molorchus minor]|uniref:Uncharacterized protein n=1 Tax=Molorchus minor TaxID=1323400 RepID=A0ABQ9JAP8_9CUCU|nr:hypothetical protein NQ317_011023 [Molorchus minor]